MKDMGIQERVERIGKAARVTAAATIGAGTIAGGLPLENPNQGLKDVKVVEAAAFPQAIPGEYQLEVSPGWDWNTSGTAVLEPQKTPAQEKAGIGDMQDWDLPRAPGVPEGHFYTQLRGKDTTGKDEPFPKGFIVTNDERAPMWRIYQQHGGAAVWGPPVSDLYKEPTTRRFAQVFQKGVFQYDPETGAIEWLNIFDVLSPFEQEGKINLDNINDITPPPQNWDSDQGRQFGHTRAGGLPGSIEENHINTVFSQSSVPTATEEQIRLLREFYLSNPLWFEQYGLPMGIKDYGAAVAVRAQRTQLQLWKDKTPWTVGPNGTVAANAGELIWKKYAPVLGLAPKGAFEAKFNPYGVGGPNTAESILQISRVVDSAETELEGKKYRVEAKVTPLAQYQMVMREETKQKLMEFVAKYGKKHGFRKISIITLAGRDEFPYDQFPFEPGKGGYSGAVSVIINNRPTHIGFKASQRIGEHLVYYFIPVDNLPLNDQEAANAIDLSLGLGVVALSSSGETHLASIFGKKDHIDLTNQRPIQLQGIGK